MVESIERGLNSEGMLPGKLGLSRKAQSFFRKSGMMEPVSAHDALLAAYAYAVAEENACGHWIVTAPTCGASGVLPRYCTILRAGYTARTKTLFTPWERPVCSETSSKSTARSPGPLSDVRVRWEPPAPCGGSGDAADGRQPRADRIRGGDGTGASPGAHLRSGIRAGPIPCIERNAHAAIRAVSCANLALLSDGSHRISFDDVVQVLLETGRALPNLYRETSTGGLARIYEKRIGRELEQSGRDES